MPGIALVTVFVALEMEMPSTVREAFTPVTAWVKPRPDEPDGVMEKLAVLPELLAIMASLEPVESVTTLAVTPRLSALIWLATPESVCVPSVVTVAEVPLPLVMVKLPAGTVAELLEIGRAHV